MCFKLHSINHHTIVNYANMHFLSPGTLFIPVHFACCLCYMTQTASLIHSTKIISFCIEFACIALLTRHGHSIKIFHGIQEISSEYQTVIVDPISYKLVFTYI